MMKKILSLFAGAMLLASTAPAADVTTLSEVFNPWGNQGFSATSLYAGHLNPAVENIKTGPETGSLWGAWGAAPAGTANAHIAAAQTAVDGVNSYSLTFRPTAIVVGTYAYCVFQGNTVTNLQSVTVVSQQASSNTTAGTKDNDCVTDLRLLVREGDGDWYISTAAGKTQVRTQPFQSNTYVIPMAGQAWEKVPAAVATEMNAVDSADPGPGAIVPEAGAPDLSQVTGGGIYIETAPTFTAPSTAVGALRFNTITWTGQDGSSVENWNAR